MENKNPIMYSKQVLIYKISKEWLRKFNFYNEELARSLCVLEVE